MARRLPQHWLLFAGPADTGLAVQLEPVMSKNGAPLSFTVGPIGERLDIELKTGEDDNTPATDIYRDLGNSARNGGECGYTLLKSEEDLRCEATSRFQFEEKYLNSDVLRNISGASADLLFGLTVVTAARKDLEYRPFAATGILTEEGQVLAIEGLRAKIDAALDIPALRGKGLIFYPKANEGDIDAELRHRVEQAQIDLKPVERLEEAVECLGIPIQGTWLENPYRRLDVFESSHRRIYFGREKETIDLAKKLFDRAEEDRASLLILGPSGGGKSSLVQAGLIPELEKRFRDHALSPLFSVFDFRSAANKDIHAIAASIRSAWSLLPGLTALAVKSSEQQTTSTSFDPFAVLISDLISYLPDQTCFVWVLDQLEQFFTLGLSEEADAAFIRFLRELQARGIWIVATFRNDFYSSLRAHDGILSVFGKDGIHDLEKLSETAIERIIQKPAKLAKVEFEYDDQKSELLSLKLKNDALGGGKDILPLLEFALDQLYQKRELKNGRIQLTWTAYEAMGGLHGAIGNRANEVLHSLDESAQEALGRVLRALAKLRRDSVQTESGKSLFIASAVNLENFPSDTAARRLVDAFAEARLFVRDRDNQGIAQVRVTHEALFTHWAKADEILKGSMKDMRIRDRLIDSEAHWKTNEEDVSLLVPSGLPLEEAQGLLTRMRDELKPEIVRYIEQSGIADQERKLKELEAQRRKTRFAILTAVVLGILLFIAAGTAYLADQREKKLAAALARSDFNEGVRLAEQGKSNEALAYLARAIRFDSRPDSAAARLAASFFFWPEHNFNISTAQIGCHEQESIVQFNAHKNFILTACGNTLQIWNAKTGKSVTPPLLQESSIITAKFSLDGNWIIIFLKGTKVQILDASSGKLVSQLVDSYSYSPLSAQFSPEGLRVAVAVSDTVRVWDTATGGEPLFESMEFPGRVDTIEFSPDGQWVIITFDNYTAQVWNVVTGKDISLPMEHESPILSAQFSSDGRYIMTRALWDDTVRVWDAVTGELVTDSIKHENHIQSAQFSPDGRWVLTASIDNTAQVWDSVTGKRVSKLMIHEDTVRSAVFSPDGRAVATVSADKTARVWDAATGIPITKPILHENYVRSVQFSPDGRRLLTISGSKIAQVWDTFTGKPVSQKFKHAEYMDFAEFSSDGHFVITISNPSYLSKSSVQVWNVVEEKSISQLRENRNYVDLTSYSHDGKWVVTINEDKSAQVWDAITRKPVMQPLIHEFPILSAQFSSNKRWVITILKDKTAQVWDVGSRTVGYSEDYASYLESVQLSPDGQWVITVANNKSAQVWDAATESEVSKPKWLMDYVQKIKFSPDKRWILTISIDNIAQVWDPVTGKPVSQLMDHGESSRDFISSEFSADGRYVFTAFWGAVKIWEAETGKLVSYPIKEKDKITVNDIKFSLDGHRLITSSADNKIHVWDVFTGRLLLKPISGREFFLSSNGRYMLTVLHEIASVIDIYTGNSISNPMRHKDYIDSAQFSPDGRLVITISRDNVALIWDATSGKIISKPIKHGIIKSIKFSPDRHNLLTISNRSARVWNVFTGAPISKLMQHEDDISIAQFSPDGRWVMTVSNDKSVRIWDTITGNPVSQPMEHTDLVSFAQFSSNKCCLVTVSEDNSLRKWDAETGKPISTIIKHESMIKSVYFSQDANHIVTVSNIPRTLEVPLFREINMEFIEFLERVSGYSIDNKNVLREENNTTKVDLRDWVNTVQFSSLEREFINWWLSDPVERTVTPYSQQTVKELVQILIDRNSIHSLNEALDYHPGHPMALARLAAATWREAKTDQQDGIRTRVVLWANLALKYAPDDIAIQEVAEKVLHDIAQPN